MRLNRKMMAVSAVLAAAVMMTACGGSTASSAVSSTASSAVSSEPASSAASSAAEQVNEVTPLSDGTLDEEDMKTGSYKFAADISSMKDGQVTFTVFGYDAYEQADIDGLEVGDVIQTHDQGDTTVTKMTVESIEKDAESGWVVINGGIEEGGLELGLDHDVYRTVTFDDYPVYYALGELTFPLAENVVILDSSADPQADDVRSEGIEAATDAFNADPDYWTCNNTTIFTDGGAVDSIVRVWVP